MSSPQANPDATPADGSSFLLGRAFYDPESAFRAIARRAAALPMVFALAALIVASVATQLVLMSKIDQEAAMRAQLEKQDMPEEQIEKAVQISATFAWIAPAVTVVILPVMMAILAGFFFLATKLVGSAAEYGKVFSAVLHAYTPPGIASSLALIAVALTKSEIEADKADRLLKSNLGAFLGDDANPALRAFLSLFDVFNFWTIALTILGLSIAGATTRKNAALAVLSLWTIWAVLKVAGAAVFALLGQG